jgi:hypothetical protein
VRVKPISTPVEPVRAAVEPAAVEPAAVEPAAVEEPPAVEPAPVPAATLLPAEPVHEAKRRRRPRLLLCLLIAVVTLIAASTVMNALHPNPGERSAADASAIARYASNQSAGVRAGESLGFSALFPESPATDSKELESGGLTLKITMLSALVNKSAYQVGLVDYPRSADLSLANFVLKEFVEGAAGKDGKVLSSTQRTVGPDPAVAFVISDPKGLFIKGVVVLRGQRIYMISVVSRSQDPPGFNRFTDSFRAL